MKLVFVAVAVLICGVVQGQKSLRFHSQNYVGVLAGDAATSFQVQTINGLKRSTWFGGIGLGIDDYFTRSVPLFLSLTRYASLNRESFFFTIDGGANFAWDGSTGNAYNGYTDNGDFNPGVFFGVSTGFRFGLKNHKDALLLNAGFSAKHLKETVGSPVPCLFPPCPESSNDYHYKLNRLSLRLGWSF